MQDVCFVGAYHQRHPSATATERLYSARYFMAERYSSNIAFGWLTSWRKNIHISSWPFGGAEENNLPYFLTAGVSVLEISRRHKTKVPNRHRKSRNWDWGMRGSLGLAGACLMYTVQIRTRVAVYMLLWPWSVFKHSWIKWWNKRSHEHFAADGYM